jgi:quinol monooxygenase YgiN
VPVLVIADIYGIAGRRQELVAALTSFAGEASTQDGCLRYTVAATLDDPDRYVTVSHWRDEAAVDAHYRSPTFAGFQMALDGLLARPSEATVFSASETLRPLPSAPMDPRDAD